MMMLLEPPHLVMRWVEGELVKPFCVETVMLLLLLLLLLLLVG
jgi:hypothetical protein